MNTRTNDQALHYSINTTNRNPLFLSKIIADYEFSSKEKIFMSAVCLHFQQNMPDL